MDWHMIDAWPDKRWVPDTCCFPAEFSTECGRKGSEVIYKTGCYEIIYKWFKERLLVIGLVGLTVAFVQVSTYEFTGKKNVILIFPAVWFDIINASVLHSKTP